MWSPLFTCSTKMRREHLMVSQGRMRPGMSKVTSGLFDGWLITKAWVGSSFPLELWKFCFACGAPVLPASLSGLEIQLRDRERAYLAWTVSWVCSPVLQRIKSVWFSDHCVGRICLFQKDFSLCCHFPDAGLSVSSSCTVAWVFIVANEPSRNFSSPGTFLLNLY